jgi:NTE family protein
MAGENRIEVGLVLQGGGALGAYEWGAVKALLALMDKAAAQKRKVDLVAVTGVSIGAINGACVVGAKDRADACRRLDGLWNDLIYEMPSWLEYAKLDLSKFGLPSLWVPRDLSLFGLPGFYEPRPDLWNFPRWTYLYETSPLLATLEKHIHFPLLNASRTAFVVTAVDVCEGRLVRFRNGFPSAEEKAKKDPKTRHVERDKRVTLRPCHILASGSLAPQFPWVHIDDRPYWDGGLIDNTPLGDAMGASPGDDVHRVLAVMNLYPLRSRRLPRNLPEVADRVHELGFGNRLRQDRATAERINGLIRTIEDLVERAKGPLPDDLAERVAHARQYRIAEVVDVDLQQDPTQEDEAGLRDFSRPIVENRRDRGYHLAWERLAACFGVTDPPPPRSKRSPSAASS